MSAHRLHLQEPVEEHGAGRCRGADSCQTVAVCSRNLPVSEGDRKGSPGDPTALLSDDVELFKAQQIFFFLNPRVSQYCFISPLF